MQVILVATDSSGKNLVFATDTLKAYSLDESVKLTTAGELESAHIVKTGRGSYLRANPNAALNDNLDYLSISSYKLFVSLDDSRLIRSVPGLKKYWEYHERFLNESVKRLESIIFIDGIPRTTRESVIARLRPHRGLIFKAAKHFEIDPVALGAIMVDEVARMLPLEDVFEKVLLHTINWNSSVGVAQVKLETARGLIRNGYYKPNPRDPKLSEKRISKVSKEYLYDYVVQPKHSVFFAAARIREIIDQWLPVIDLSDRPEIIGTLYSQPPRKSRKNPRPTTRGLQIQQEFYPLAKKILHT